MGNTVESARFRGLVQVLGERTIKDVDEINVYRDEFWKLRLDSADDFYSKFSAQDARDILETGNAFFLIEESLERLSKSKTACRVLSRLIPALFSSHLSLPSGHVVAPQIISTLCEDKIGFEDEKEEDEDVLWALFPDQNGETDSTTLDENRIELLRLLVVALSEPLYNKAVSAGDMIHFAFDEVVDATFREESISERATNLFVSMLAVVALVGPNPKHPRAELGTHCQNALTCLLDIPADETNPLIYVIGNLPVKHRERLLDSLSKRAIAEKCSVISTLCLIWRMLNLESMSSAMSSDTACALIFAVCSALFSYRKDARSLHSVIQLTSILFFLLTCDRRTGIALNKPLERIHSKQIPNGFCVISNEWTYMDFAFTCVQKFIMEGDQEMFEPLMRLTLTGLGNLAWYVKSLHAQPSSNLIALFERVSKKRFLFARESNPLYARAILEIINSILQYQSQGNANLIYAIMRSRHVFFNISELQCPPQIVSQQQQGQEPSAQEEQVEEEKQQSDQTQQQQQQQEPEERANSTDTSNNSSSTTSKSSTTSGTTGVVPTQSPTSSIFKPTKEWFDAWKPQLPFTICIYTIRELAPTLDYITSGKEEDFLNAIKGSTLVGALPPPPPIVINKYARTDKIDSIVRRSFWIHLFASDDYLDLWQVPLARSDPTRPRAPSV